MEYWNSCYTIFLNHLKVKQYDKLQVLQLPVTFILVTRKGNKMLPLTCNKMLKVNGREVLVNPNFADPTWVCEADGYDPENLDIPVLAFEAHSSVAAVMVNQFQLFIYH